MNNSYRVSDKLGMIHLRQPLCQLKAKHLT